MLEYYVNFEQFNNCYSLGRPSVTFLSDTPAKWKVFNVIWVVGSPTDCEAIHPTASPAGAKDLKNLYFIYLIRTLKF